MTTISGKIIGIKKTSTGIVWVEIESNSGLWLGDGSLSFPVSEKEGMPLRLGQAARIAIEFESLPWP